MISPAEVPSLDSAEHRTAQAFAAWMTGSTDRGAAELTAAALRAQAPGLAPLLAAVVRAMEGRQRRERAALGFAGMDDLLRAHSTVAVDLEHPQVRGDVRRLHVLQAELQRECLSTTLRALPVVPRAAFILHEILGWSREQIEPVLGTACSVQTAHNRARDQLDNYLSPRCEHLDPKNACRCATRLGIALDRGFVTWPERHVSEGPPSAGRRFSDVGALVASLPSPP